MNGDRADQSTPSARDLTREIDRETNLAIEAQDMAEKEAGARGSEELGGANVSENGSVLDSDSAWAVGGDRDGLNRLSNEQAVNLGNKVLTYDPERVARAEGRVDRGDERIREMVDVENALGGELAELDGRKVGGSEAIAQESELLVAERESWNKENLLNETDPKRDHEAEIMAHDQRGIAEGVAKQVEVVTRGNDFRIMDLVLLQSRGRDATLEAYENPRRLGDMN